MRRGGWSVLERCSCFLLAGVLCVFGMLVVVLVSLLGLGLENGGWALLFFGKGSKRRFRG